MKKFIFVISLMIIGCVCYADTPYIPEHLTNPNYDFKNRKIGTIGLIDKESGNGKITITTSNSTSLSYFALGINKVLTI